MRRGAQGSVHRAQGSERRAKGTSKKNPLLGGVGVGSLRLFTTQKIKDQRSKTKETRRKVKGKRRK